MYVYICIHTNHAADTAAAHEPRPGSWASDLLHLVKGHGGAEDVGGGICVCMYVYIIGPRTEAW
jgi:hypothetical protein